MKASKRIMIWIIISLILQCTLYVFLDKYYYASAGSIKITDITAEEQVKKIVPNVALGSTAKNVTLSDDLAYTATLEDGLVKVVDTSTGKTKANLTYSSGVKCLAYMWVPGTDIMDIVEKVNNTTIKFYSYDADKEIKTEIDDSTTHKALFASAGQSAEMKMSVLTGVLYIKIGHSNDSFYMYRIDRNEQLKRVLTLTNNIGTFAVASSDDQLIYNDIYGRIKVYNYAEKSSIIIPGVLKPSIIGTDDNDNFYVGNGSLQSNAIYYGKLSDNISSWKKIVLGTMIDNKNIVVLPNGGIYTLDRQNSIVTDVKGNKTYNYQGTFLQINNGNIIYNNGGKLKFKPL
ncbi:hypothetical protein [Clostridium akagii]|uniref:hypothetical protein n=1 Tax=Clostridium akagii TaxID=91623 RepID=UPI00047977B6|nr:hypothetical protein [Clostridium akagii]